MAEVAGLVIGGVGLAALFSTCMETFEYVESGSNYGKAYQKSALRLTLLRLRLSRWGETVKFIDEPTGGRYEELPVASDKDSKKVNWLLGEIHASLEDAERAAKRYECEQPAADGDTRVAAITEKVRTMAIRRQKSSSFVQKARWALHDEKKFGKVIGELSEFITNLTELFPATKPIQEQLASADAAEVISPSEIKDPSEVVGIAYVDEATTEVDPMLKQAMQEKMPAERRHAFNKVMSKGRATVINGDEVAAGAQVNGYGHDYNGVYADGYSQVLNGNRYGGRSILDGP